MKRHIKWFAAYATAMIVVSTVAICDDFRHPTHAAALAVQVTKQVMHGHLNGDYQGHPVTLQQSRLKPADILLFHNQNGAYGYFTHAVIYVGDGKVVDAYSFSHGTVIRPIYKYTDYDRVVVYRAPLSEGAQAKVVKAALASVGKTYDPFSSLSDTRSEYCSKLIWQCYSAVGVPICNPDVWVIPDDVALSPNLRRVYEWSSSSKA